MFNNMNPAYMKSIFQKQANARITRQTLNLKSQKYKSKKYGFNSLRVMDSIIWNSFPNTIKTSKGIIYRNLKIKLKTGATTHVIFSKKIMLTIILLNNSNNFVNSPVPC